MILNSEKKTCIIKIVMLSDSTSWFLSIFWFWLEFIFQKGMSYPFKTFTECTQQWKSINLNAAALLNVNIMNVIKKCKGNINDFLLLTFPLIAKKKFIILQTKFVRESECKILYPF